MENTEFGSCTAVVARFSPAKLALAGDTRMSGRTRFLTCRALHDELRCLLRSPVQHAKARPNAFWVFVGHRAKVLPSPSRTTPSPPIVEWIWNRECAEGSTSYRARTGRRAAWSGLVGPKARKLMHLSVARQPFRAWRQLCVAFRAWSPANRTGWCGG